MNANLKYNQIAGNGPETRTITGAREMSGTIEVKARMHSIQKFRNDAVCSLGREVLHKVDGNEADWNNITEDIFELILDFLPLTDYMRVASVSKEWHTMQVKHRLFNADCPRYRGSRMPWILIHGYPTDSEILKSIYNTVHKTYYNVPLPMEGLEFCGATHGWLSFMRKKESELIFLNPLSLGQVRVPLDGIPVEPLVIKTSVPTNEDAVVFTWSGCGDSCFTRIRDLLPNFRNVPRSRYSGFPVTIRNRFIINLGPRAGEKLTIIHIVPYRPSPVLQDLTMKIPEQLLLPSHTFYVECHEALLLVNMVLVCNKRFRFQIFRAKISRRTWEPVFHLGQHALFLSCNTDPRYAHNFSLPAHNDIKANTIYCTGSLVLGSRVQNCMYIEYDFSTDNVQYIIGPSVESDASGVAKVGRRNRERIFQWIQRTS